MLIDEIGLSLVLFSIASFISFVYYISKIKFNYWKKKHVVYPKPVPFFGNYANYITLKEYLGQVTQKICQQFPDKPYIGTFYGTEPTLVVQDPDLIKLVMTKDFYYFSSREISSYTNNEVMTQNLFFTYGDRWKVIRQNLTPLFSSAKMRNMFYLIENCARVFEGILDVEAGCKTVEVRSLMTRFTMDCIGLCAFGVNTNTMVKLDDNPFSTMGKLIFESTNYRGAKAVARALWPAIFYSLGFKLFPTNIEKFFTKLLTGVFESRQYKPSPKNDFIDLVLNLKQNNYIVGDSLRNMISGENKRAQLEIDNDLLVAQCIVFFAAGFETSATTLSFTLYELAKNEEAQRKAQAEVDAFLHKHGNKVEYSCVTELPYLEACIDEALRLYPVLGVLTREVVEKYTLPSGLEVDKGVRIHIPVYHLQHSPDHFPEPERFRPERFLRENKKNVKPYTYMPFGEGPRICIGK